MWTISFTLRDSWGSCVCSVLCPLLDLGLGLVGTWELGLGLGPELDSCRVTDAPCWPLSSPYCHQSGQKISQWRKLDTMSPAQWAAKHNQAVTVTGNTHSATIVSLQKISAHRITMLDLELEQKRSIKAACLLLHSQEISENEANLSNNPWPWGDLLSALH